MPATFSSCSTCSSVSGRWPGFSYSLLSSCLRSSPRQAAVQGRRQPRPARRGGGYQESGASSSRFPHWPGALLCDRAFLDAEQDGGFMGFAALTFLGACEHLIGGVQIKVVGFGKFLDGFALALDPGLCLCWGADGVHHSKPLKPLKPLKPFKTIQSIQWRTDYNSNECCKWSFISK